MLAQVKENLFTIPGVLTSIIHVFIVVGVLASYVFFEVSVMGREVAVGFSDSSKSRK